MQTATDLRDTLVAKLVRLGFSDPGDYRVQIAKLTIPATGNCSDIQHASLIEGGDYISRHPTPMETTFRKTICNSFKQAGASLSANAIFDGQTDSRTTSSLLGIQISASLEHTIAGSLIWRLVVYLRSIGS